MRAQDVMTKPAITIAENACLRDLVALLLERRISGVPVIDEEGRFIGQIGEGELVHRFEIGTDDCVPRRSWWQWLVGIDPSPSAYVKSHATCVRDLMSEQTLSVRPQTPLSEIARIFESRQIRRLPVMHGREMLGIVTRSDLMKALAGACVESNARRPSDDWIRASLLKELLGQRWWPMHLADVRVHDGVVTFAGITSGEDEMRASRVAAEGIAGVRQVKDDRLIGADWRTVA